MKRIAIEVEAVVSATAKVRLEIADSEPIPEALLPAMQSDGIPDTELLLEALRFYGEYTVLPETVRWEEPLEQTLRITFLPNHSTPDSSIPNYSEEGGDE